jgi:hypothetical protein
MYRAPVNTRSCEQCDASLDGRRSDARYCSDRCRYESWERKHPQRLSTASTAHQTLSGNSTGSAPRRPSRDGRGVRVYVLPEDDEATILAKARAARGDAIG